MPKEEPCEGGILRRSAVAQHTCKPPSISDYRIEYGDEWKCSCGCDWICSCWDEPGARGGLKWEKI